MTAGPGILSVGSWRNRLAQNLSECGLMRLNCPRCKVPVTPSKQSAFPMVMNSTGKMILPRHCERPRWVDHLRSGICDQPGQHGETPSLLKIQKLAGRGATPEAEAGDHLNPGGGGCSEPRLCRFTSAWVTDIIATCSLLQMLVQGFDTQEAEAGESLEPRRGDRGCRELRSRHCLGDRAKIALPGC
ncbi:hypothetical protein AAY473_002389, partial [Plecturocebus cupreus]